MRVTLDEVNDVIRNYYNDAHPELSLQSVLWIIWLLLYIRDLLRLRM